MRQPSTFNSPRGSTVLTDPVIWVIVAAGLLLRIGYNLALHPDGHPFSAFVIDEREYFAAAHMLAEGRGFSFFDTALWVRPPLYVLLLGVLIRAFGSDYLPVLLAQSLLSAATILALAWLGHRLGGLTAARITAALAALYIPFTLFAGLLLSETLFVFLFALGLVLLVRARETVGNAQGLSRFLWPAGAGAILGLAILTRGTALAFLPLAALWLFLAGAGAIRPRVAGAVLMIGVCLLVLVPWTLRNYAAYGRFVPVDTTAGYNLWLGSVGVRDEERLQAELRDIPNPADRQAHAYARAWETIGDDPAFFLGKGLGETLDLWQPLFSAEERQIAGYTLGRVPAWHLVALLLLDDLLYLAVLLLAIVGLFAGPSDPLKWLTLLWVLLWVSMSFVFFAVTRFRLPVVAALLPWAGVGATILFSPNGLAGAWRRLTAPARVAATVLVAATLFVVVPAIPLGPSLQGIERWAQQAPYRDAEALLAAGNPAEAVEQYRRANTGLADTRYGLAAALLQTRTPDDALQQLVPNEPDDRFEPYIIRGEAARRAGDPDAARTFFNERVVRLAGDVALRWAWDHLDPPVVDGLDLGTGLDIGYIRGFQSPEEDSGGVPFRWTLDEAEVRNVQIGQRVVQFKWSGWRPQGLPPARVSVSLPPGGLGFTSGVMLQNSSDWQDTEVRFGSIDSLEAPWLLRLRTNAFIPSGSDPRLLGVRVSRVAAP